MTTRSSAPVLSPAPVSSPVAVRSVAVFGALAALAAFALVPILPGQTGPRYELQAQDPDRTVSERATLEAARVRLSEQLRVRQQLVRDRARPQMARRAVMGREARQLRSRALSIELIMRARDRLELTDDQLSQLEAMRAEGVRIRNAAAAEAAELRSRIAAGQVEPAAAREARREAVRERLDAADAGNPTVRLRESLQEILSEEQLESITNWQRNNRTRAARAHHLGRGGGQDRAWRGRAGGCGGAWDRARRGRSGGWGGAMGGRGRGAPSGGWPGR